MSAFTERLNDEFEQLLARVRGNKSVQELEQKYHSLSDRDRMAVNILSFFLLIVLLFKMILLPALGYLNSSSRAYQSQLDDYEWMVAKEPEARKQLESSGSSLEGSLLSLASSTAKNHQLTFNRFEPIGNDRVRLWLEQVKFNDIVNWLGELEAEKGVSAVDISLDSASPGYVSVRLTLQG